MDQTDAINDERGATAIEYALLVALIALSAMMAMDGIGTRIMATFMVIAEALGFGGVGGGAPSIP